MLPFEQYLMQDAATAIRAARQEGKSLGLDEAIEQAVETFKNRVGSFQEKAQNQVRQRAVMKLDVGGSQPPPKVDADKIWKMSNDEFHAFEKQINKKLYGY